jgi:V/A-type H+-transporting ATPase subunit B
MAEQLLKNKLATKEYRTLAQIKGPLIFVERVANVAFDEMVQIIDPDGNSRVGRVLEIDGDMAIVQMFLGTEGLDISRTGVRFSGDVVRLKVSLSMLGRILNGMGEPIDGGPDIVPEKLEDINGSPINPAVRNEPKEFIQPVFRRFDGLNSLARGQKLPIFSGSGYRGMNWQLRSPRKPGYFRTEKQVMSPLQWCLRQSALPIVSHPSSLSIFARVVLWIERWCF